MRLHISREQLYRRVWEHSAPAVAKELGMSVRELTQTCRKNKIPIPGPEHWRAIDDGKPVPIPPLSLTDGPDTVLIGRDTDILLRPMLRTGQKSKAHATTRRTVLAFHAMRLHSSLTRQVPDKNNIVRVVDRTQFRVEIPASSIERAVRVLDELCDLVVGLGYELEPSDHGLSVQVGDQSIPLKLRQKRTSSPAKDVLAAGRLELVVDGGHGGDGLRRRFTDGKKQLLEDLLPQVVASISATAATRRSDPSFYGPAMRKRRGRASTADRLAYLKDLAKKLKEYRDIAGFLEFLQPKEFEQDLPGELQEFIDWSVDYSAMLREELSPATIRQQLIEKGLANPRQTSRLFVHRAKKQ